MQIRVGGTTFVVASTAAVAKDMLKTHDSEFASRCEFGPTEYNIYSGAGFITGPNGSYWRFMKKLCMTKLFAGPQLDRFNHIREQENTNLLKSLLKRSREEEACDLSTELTTLTTLTNNLICRMALSKRCSDNATGAKEVRRLVLEITGLGAKLGVYEVFGPLKKLDIFGNGKKLVEGLWRYDRFMEQIMKDYEDDMVGGEGKEGADLMSIVLEAYKDTNAEVKLTRKQIKFFFIVSFSSLYLLFFLRNFTKKPNKLPLDLNKKKLSIAPLNVYIKRLSGHLVTHRLETLNFFFFFFNYYY
jgi:hypothetical protein